MLRRELHIKSAIWAFLLSNGPSRVRVMVHRLPVTFGSSISLLSVIGADNEGWMLTDFLNPRIQRLQEGVIFPMTRILPRRDDVVAAVSQTHLKSDLKQPGVKFLSIPLRRHRFKHRYHFIS